MKELKGNSPEETLGNLKSVLKDSEYKNFFIWNCIISLSLLGAVIFRRISWKTYLAYIIGTGIGQTGSSHLQRVGFRVPTWLETFRMGWGQGFDSTSNSEYDFLNGLVERFGSDFIVKNGQ